MNKKKALKEETKRHEEIVETIKFAYTVVKKVEPLLPKGWISKYSHFYDHLIFSSGEPGKKNDKKPSEEFKLVCKILDKICDFKGKREAVANEDTDELTKLEARFYFDKEGIDTLAVDVQQFNPKHKCKIKWEKKSFYTSTVSDECLGLDGE